MVAELAKTVVKNPEQFLEDIEYNPTITQKIADVFKNLLKNFKNMFTTSEQKQIQKAYDTLVKAVKNQSQSETKTTQTGSQTTTAILAMQYDLNSTFAEQIDAVENNDYDKTHLKVSDHTPLAIQEVGYNDLPILITANKVKTAIGIKVRGKNTHNISKETLKSIPTLLQKPIDILQSKTRADSIVVVLDAVDNEGSQIVCSMVKDGTGNYNNIEISSNVITSIYGKENSKGLLETSKKAQKKELDITETPSLQLANNLNNSTSNNNIRQSLLNVNSNSQNNSKNGVKYDLADDFREMTDADVPVEYKKSNSSTQNFVSKYRGSAQYAKDNKSAVKNLIEFSKETLMASENINKLVEDVIAESSAFEKFKNISKYKKSNIVYGKLILNK